MDRHTSEMLHDPTTHEAIRRFELYGVIVVAIAVMYAIFYHLPF